MFTNLSYLKSIAVAILLLASICSQSWGADLNKINITGQWLGSMAVGGNLMPLQFNISLKSDGSYVATMDSPGQGEKDIPVADVSLLDDQLVLNIRVAGAIYEGKVLPKEDLIEGYWKQSGQKFELILKREKISFVGLWQGQLGDTKAILQIRISQNSDGRYTATVSPDLGINEISASEVVISGETITLKVKAEGVTYTGTLSDDGKNIEGNFNQANRNFILSLNPAETKSIVLVRPQEPIKPYPYISEDVSFNNSDAEITLVGTLTIPKEKGTYPAVILISGSGPQDRDQKWMGHKTFLVLADYFTRNGIAVLRVDDRGVGKSTGDFSLATSADFATDVEAAIEYLKTRKDIKHNKIGLVGHSEGGLIAPIVATKSDDVAFIVMMAGPGISGMDISVNQFESILKFNGVTDATIKSAVDIYKQVNIASIENSTKASSAEKLHEIYDLAWNKLGVKAKAELSRLGGGKLSQQRVDSLRTPWNRYFLNHQPKNWLSKVTVPVLAINGSKDVQMIAKDNLKGISDALTKAGNKNFKIIELEGMNHLFQNAKTGLLSEYSKIEQTIAPEALELMSDWIVSIVNTK